jgi:thiol:disulfide interchange protein
MRKSKFLWLILWMAASFGYTQEFAKASYWLEYSAGMKQALAQNKMVFVSAWAPWCKSCAIMEQETYNKPIIKEMLQEFFVPVHLNFESTQLIACQGKTLPTKNCIIEEFQIQALPAFAILSPRGTLVLSVMDLLDPSELTSFIQQVLEHKAEILKFDLTQPDQN